jgi:hypothetical protein
MQLQLHTNLFICLCSVYTEIYTSHNELWMARHLDMQVEYLQLHKIKIKCPFIEKGMDSSHEMHSKELMFEKIRMNRVNVFIINRLNVIEWGMLLSP